MADHFYIYWTHICFFLLFFYLFISSNSGVERDETIADNILKMEEQTMSKPCPSSVISIAHIKMKSLMPTYTIAIAYIQFHSNSNANK